MALPSDKDVVCMNCNTRVKPWRSLFDSSPMESDMCIHGWMCPKCSADVDPVVDSSNLVVVIQVDSTLAEPEPYKRQRELNDKANDEEAFIALPDNPTSKMTMGRITIPMELVGEILSRVPAASLARFKLTSKPWNAMIKDANFAKKHLATAAPSQALTIMLVDFRLRRVNLNLVGFNDNVAPSTKITGQFSLKDPLSNFSEEVDIRDVYHCKGSLLCITLDNRLVVWNPCSGETKWINPKNIFMETDCYAFGYDPKRSCYKIVRLNEYVDVDNSKKIVCEIYDFATNLWRDLRVDDYWVIPLCGRRGIYVEGYNYWLALSLGSRNHSILRFDFEEETFLLQFSTVASPFRMSLSALSVGGEEHLCILINDPLSIQVMVSVEGMSKNDNVAWWDWFLATQTDYDFSPFMSFLADEQNKAVVCCDNGKVPNNIFHILGEHRRHIQVEHSGAESGCSLLLTYVPTLTPIQQGI